ncbi:MAG TPA: chromosome segregation protein SMC [Candidatus Lustribacter sp.]|nr:chromosome segregation protein SMC [Candidatus Lustribacter sp.]
MRLKTLKVFGFKTFAESTLLDFNTGITAVVGPNGSGKSNLVDAIRWVLGEQNTRQLRSQHLEDVIFAGNTTRKPLGMAEVSLTFDNSDHALPIDFDEVQITRRAYRVGESEFFINRSAVRLRDVVELLMGTGLGPGSYAIVSQGQIDAILSSKPTERRALFEETAGIGKFLARKAEAMRRLDGTEQNAIRVNDLLSELERRVPELDTQVRRARRYRRLTARVRDLEILSYLRASASRREERERVAADANRTEDARAAAAARAATLGAEAEALRSQLYTLELEREERRVEAQAAREITARIEADLAAATARRDALDAQSHASIADRDRVESERERLRTRIDELTAQLAPLTERAEEIRGREATATHAVTAARTALDTIYADLRGVEAMVAERAASEAERRARLAGAQSDIARLTGERGRLDGERTRLAARAAETRTVLDECDVLIARYEQTAAQQRDLATAEGARGDAAEARVADLQARYRGVASDLAASESRLHTIEELEATLEGHVPGTRAVVEAAARGDLTGLHGVVSNLIEVDEQYARALDVAFGAGLSNIVTATSEDAERAIAYLREREAGRATFLPLDTLAERHGHTLGALRGRPGIVGYAHELVRSEARFRGIVSFLVGAVLVVDELRTGIALVRGENFRDSIVTLEGEQILGGGAITGGRYRRERSILGRRAQAQSLRERIPQLRAELETIERDGLAAKADVEAAFAARDAAVTAAGEAEAALRDASARRSGAEAEIARVDGELAATAQRASEVQRELESAQQLHAALEGAPVDAADLEHRRESLVAALATARETIASAEAVQHEVAAEAGALRETFASLGTEREGHATRLGLLDADSERVAATREQTARELERLRDAIAGETARLATTRDAVAAADAAVNAANARREATANDLAQREADERIAHNDDREATAAGEGSRRRLAEIDAELGMLVQSFAQNPATDEEQRDVVERYANEPDDVIEELPRLREELARLSANVNLNAEADRDELVERERFLREQLADLQKARETLLATIAEIELSSQAQFNETFAAVAARFAETFGELFPGGEARMWQTDPEHLSETGIEIAVQPPGKKMTALAALSGGERAMTAAALIFALIRVKPSPFYLLDEVDAALDDANVDRLSDMIRRLASDSQMLIVTHNKKTMELASRMYGVTMQEPGVSSIISASLDAAGVPVAEREEAAIAG